MVEKHPRRKELAAQFSQIGEHSPEAIERVLAAFIDPNNPKMSLDNFSNQLTRMAIGTGGRGLTRDDRHVAQALRGVLDDVRDARLFNETYLGHLLSESSIPGMLGYMLAMRTGSNTVAREVSLTESKLEPEAIHGLMEIVGYDPEQGSGTFTSGGSMANMTALAVARELMQEKIEQVGDTPGTMRVLTSPFAHYSVGKMCNLLGGPGRQIQVQPIKSQELRMSTSDVDQKITDSEREGIQIMAILAIAGETETGLVDPLNDIADIAEEHSVNLIVDGAYGAPYRLSRVGNKFVGMERAMAVTIDPHKALYTPYNNGAVLFKNAENHARLNLGVEAAYLGIPKVDRSSEEFQRDLNTLVARLRGEQTGELRGNLGEKRIEGSMSAGPILSTLAVLRTLGKEGLGVIYDLTLDRTDRLYDRISQSPYLMPMHERELNMLCFTLTPEIRMRVGVGMDDPDALHDFIEDTRRELDKGIKGEGGYFFSATDLPDDKGSREWVYRSCIMHPRTTNSTIDNAVSGLEAIIEQRLSRKR